MPGTRSRAFLSRRSLAQRTGMARDGLARAGPATSALRILTQEEPRNGLPPSSTSIGGGERTRVSGASHEPLVEQLGNPCVGPGIWMAIARNGPVAPIGGGIS